jgi:hypothetical protein
MDHFLIMIELGRFDIPADSTAERLSEPILPAYWRSYLRLSYIDDVFLPLISATLLTFFSLDA